MTVLVGLLLTAAVTLTLRAIWGVPAILPGLVFGGLATAIQAGAERLLRGGIDLPFDRLMVRHGLGMGLRLLGVVLIVVAVLADRGHFPALPTAFGYLGVMIPLLALELRLAR